MNIRKQQQSKHYCSTRCALFQMLEFRVEDQSRIILFHSASITKKTYVLNASHFNLQAQERDKVFVTSYFNNAVLFFKFQHK